MIGWREVTSAATWQALLAAADRSSLQQSWAYGAAVAAAGHGVHRLGRQEAGSLTALVQLLRRPLACGLGFGLVLRGPVWLAGRPDPRQEERLLCQLLPWIGRQALLWQPDDADAADRRAGARRVWTGASTVLLDLDRPPGALRAALDGKWRNRLVRAEAAPLTLRRCRQGPSLDWLLGETERQRQARGYAGPAPAFTKALAAASGPDALCLTAEHGGNPVAGMLFLRHGRTATWQVGATTAAGRRLGAHHRLLWAGIAALAEAGCTTLDLGLVDTVTSPGIARFKLGTGAAPLTLAGSYFLPPRLRQPRRPG